MLNLNPVLPSNVCCQIVWFIIFRFNCIQILHTEILHTESHISGQNITRLCLPSQFLIEFLIASKVRIFSVHVSLCVLGLPKSHLNDPLGSTTAFLSHSSEFFHILDTKPQWPKSHTVRLILSTDPRLAAAYLLVSSPAAV